MIYLVSKQPELFDNDVYKPLSVQESIDMICSWSKVQYDSETKGVDAHIVPVLCAQFGNKKAGVQIVVDASTVDLRLYKEALEGRLVIGQNLLFDLPFLYNYGIHPTQIYDTMIAEQVLYLGYPSVLDGGPSMSLAAIAERRLGIYISKEVRGQIIWRGLDTEVIKYAANDVVYLEDIMWSQIADARKKNCVRAIQLECSFVPVLAYVMWCGIRIDVPKWKMKMEKDNKALQSTIEQLNEFVVKRGDKKFITVNIQGDLFLGFDTTPKCAFQWKQPGVKAKNTPILQFIKSLGFNTKTKDKKTGAIKDSIELKILKKQKGVNDEFLKLYIEYSEALKVCTSYGIAYLNAINPYTNRIHTQFKQIGADTGRITCNDGGDSDEEKIKINPDLAKLKGFPQKTTDVILNVVILIFRHCLLMN
jgi:DNA polymerase I-like protein with 3'-5' exonuclease and polymerase domains